MIEFNNFFFLVAILKAALGYRNESNHVRFNGAGVIISEYYILTAAHCVLATRKPNVVRLGVVSEN